MATPLATNGVAAAQVQPDFLKFGGIEPLPGAERLDDAREGVGMRRDVGTLREGGSPAYVEALDDAEPRTERGGQQSFACRRADQRERLHAEPHAAATRPRISAAVSSDNSPRRIASFSATGREPEFHVRFVCPTSWRIRSASEAGNCVWGRRPEAKCLGAQISAVTS